MISLPFSKQLCDKIMTVRHVLLFTENAIRTVDKRRRQSTSGHVTPPLVVAAIVISTVAVIGAVVLTVVVRCRRHHSRHYQGRQPVTSGKQTAAQQPTHVTTPFVVTSSRGAVTSLPVGRHAGYDRVAPLIPHARYEAGMRPSC